MGESKLFLALFCNKILTKTEQGVVVVVISWRSGCVTLTVTLQLYRGGGCGDCEIFISCGHCITRPLTSRSILSPAAAMSGTARQQSKSVVLVWLICRIRSYGRSRPEVSAGPPGLIRATKMPRSYRPSDTENPKSSNIGSLNSDTLLTS